MTLFCGAVLFTIGGAIQTFTMGYEVMVTGRVVSGFGVGLLSCVLSLVVNSRKSLNILFRTIVPIYQSEVSPPTHVSAINMHSWNTV